MGSHIGDEFQNQLGKWEGYFALPADHNDQIEDQKHTDLRAIGPKSTVTEIKMIHLTALFDMQTLQERTMQQLDGTIRSHTGEGWSKGYITKDPARNNWSVLTIACKSSGTTISQSILRR
jgi:hypothetical protein